MFFSCFLLTAALQRLPRIQIAFADPGECTFQDARDRHGQTEFCQFFFTRPGKFQGVASRGKRSTVDFAEIIENDEVILRAGCVARRAIRIGWGGKNSLEHFDQFEYPHFEAGFFGEFPHDALLERFSYFEKSARDGPLAFQWGAGAPDQESAFLINHDSANADHGMLGVFSSRGHNRFGCFPMEPVRVI